MQALPDPRREILRGKAKLGRTRMSAQEGVQVCAIGNQRQPEEASEAHRSSREGMLDKHFQAAPQHFALLISGKELVGAIGTDVVSELILQLRQVAVVHEPKHTGSIEIVKCVSSLSVE